MKLCAIPLFAAVIFSTCALGDEIHFTNGQPVTVEPDKAYILVRAFEKPCGWVCGYRKFTPILIRALSSEELKQADVLAQQDPDHWKDRVDSNVVMPSLYAEEGTEEFLFTPLKPGTYFLGGLMGAPGGIQASLCMGTVRFEAKPGVITDLGTILNARNDEPTTIPELSNYVTGKPMGDQTFLEAVAIRPATSTTEVPEPLRSLPLAAADYRAVSPFPNYIGGSLMRLAPLAGVLAYDKGGQVIDLKSGQGASR